MARPLGGKAAGGESVRCGTTAYDYDDQDDLDAPDDHDDHDLRLSRRLP